MDKKRRLAEIAREIEDCPFCRSWGEGKAVPGEGNPDARIVFIGEAPGREESRSGRPFVGRSGRFLRQIIAGMGLREEDVFITSPVKYLPLLGTPSKENIMHARNHLLRQLSVIDPALVVLMGNTACLAVLGRKLQLTEEHGKTVRTDGRTCFLSFHPAYAARFPEAKRLFIEDFRKLKKFMDEHLLP